MNITGEIKILLIVMGCIYAMFSLSGLYLIFNPPRKINSLFGYHSENASRNQANWDYANKLAGQLMFIIANISFVLALASVYFLQNKVPIDGLWAICICLLCFSYVPLLPIVEIKLSKFEEVHKKQL